ncbi:MAG TPA: MBL fold metallo-hydrolase [Roseiflexaceae bacterium]|nr:MBL fold metallo-hydrolase [Roseiflexaceae bacterium]
MTAGSITRYEAPGGVRIYRIPTQAFAMLIAHVYVVVAGDYVALVDTSSGLGESNAQLEAGLAALRDEWGEAIGWADIRRIVITHAHIDHYGGLGYVRERCAAPVAVHTLDRRVLINHEERLILSSRALATFLHEAGVPQERYNKLLQLYSWSKGLFRSVEVETDLHHGDTLDGLFTVHHAPGHCPGQVCLRVGDVLLCADHVLPRTSPHLAPESITASTGLEHYLLALRSVASSPGVRLALGGHEEPIEDLYGRIAQIEASHQRKLDRLLHACAEPHTIDELAQQIYGHVHGYDTLLALLEIGAHLEYLDHHGMLAIANLDDLTRDEQAVPKYRRL